MTKKPIVDTAEPIFEVFKDGERYMWTSDPKCIPSPSVIAGLKENGYRITRKNEPQPPVKPVRTKIRFMPR